MLIVAFVGWSHWVVSRSAAGVIEGVVFVLAIFACIVLHELGHALTARRYGIATRDITLYPIGGVARLERMPDKPAQELLVALAGPAVNVVIALALALVLALTGTLRPVSAVTLTAGPFLERLLITNLFLVGFNLIPAFPMDGGRVLRALLAMRIPYPRATQIAAHVGQGVALLFGLVGLFGNPILLFVALFVWIGAGQEANFVQTRSVLGGVPVWKVMLTDFRVLDETDPLSHAAELLLQGSQQDFPVMSGNEVVGILTRTDLVQSLTSHPPGDRVSAFMKRDFLQVEADEMIESLFVRLQQSSCRTVPVRRNGVISGLVTLENVGEFLMIQSALKQQSGEQTLS